MPDPHEMVNNKMNRKADELNNSPISKAMKDSLPFVLASMTMQGITESAKAIKETVTSVIDQAKEITNKVNATLFKQVNGDYGVSTREIDSKDLNTNAMKNNELRANEVRTNEVNPNAARTNNVAFNQNQSDLSEITFANNNFGDFSDHANESPVSMSAPVIIDKPTYWTPPNERMSLNTWNEMGKELVNTAKEGMKELGNAAISLTKQHGSPERTY